MFMYIFHKFINYTNIYAPKIVLNNKFTVMGRYKISETNSLSWEDSKLAKQSKESVFQFILTFLEREHSLFSSGVGVILGVSYLTPALVKYRYWHAECGLRRRRIVLLV